MSTPNPPVTQAACGNRNDAMKGIRAAATISIILMRLKVRWLTRLFRSYQAISSSRRSMIGSGAQGWASSRLIDCAILVRERAKAKRNRAPQSWRATVQTQNAPFLDVVHARSFTSFRMTPLDGMDEGRLHQNDTGVWTKDSQVQDDARGQRESGWIRQNGVGRTPAVNAVRIEF